MASKGFTIPLDWKTNGFAKTRWLSSLKFPFYLDRLEGKHYKKTQKITNVNL